MSRRVAWVCVSPTQGLMLSGAGEIVWFPVRALAEKACEMAAEGAVRDFEPVVIVEDDEPELVTAPDYFGGAG